MKIKRVTFVFNEDDVGVVFELPDGRTGRAIVPIDLKVREAVLAASEKSLGDAAEAIGGEAVEPGAVTSALMKLRAARQEEALANMRVAEADALLSAKRQDLSEVERRLAAASLPR